MMLMSFKNSVINADRYITPIDILQFQKWNGKFLRFITSHVALGRFSQNETFYESSENL